MKKTGKWTIVTRDIGWSVRRGFFCRQCGRPALKYRWRGGKGQSLYMELQCGGNHTWEVDLDSTYPLD